MMSELWGLLKKYLISAIVIALLTLMICGVIIAKTNTDIMLFGNT